MTLAQRKKYSCRLHQSPNGKKCTGLCFEYPQHICGHRISLVSHTALVGLWSTSSTLYLQRHMITRYAKSCFYNWDNPVEL
ncbi:hypothetical protein GDO81_015438 [Engystomops pustulosus]|uniref:Uncharacterized protein n=1 Tax=Engystomops pustulosus TaxID=76066 RepID=A0AAV7AK95_ENGPU|nr:hypothetical protein GDO81_015438 [Engystomops pustulosus]